MATRGTRLQHKKERLCNGLESIAEPLRVKTWGKCRINSASAELGHSQAASAPDGHITLNRRTAADGQRLIGDAGFDDSACCHDQFAAYGRA